jgi:hypothetical protein
MLRAYILSKVSMKMSINPRLVKPASLLLFGGRYISNRCLKRREISVLIAVGGFLSRYVSISILVKFCNNAVIFGILKQSSVFLGP